jgi:hypothetical protein
MCNAENLEVHLHSLEHLKENVAGLDEALQPFIMRIKMAQFNMTKSLEDYKITLQRVAMAAKWTSDWKKGMGRQSDCPLKNSLKLADHALDKAKEQEIPETRLKILESGRDELVNIAEAVHNEAGQICKKTSWQK